MAERTILLKGERGAVYLEGIAGGAIIPGQSVILGSGGTYTVGPAAAAAPADNTLIIAREREQENYNGATNHNVDTAYASNDRLFMAALSPGAEFYGLLPAAATAVVKGSRLEYAAGNFRLATTGVVKAIALEAVDNSAGGAVARCIMQAV